MILGTGIDLVQISRLERALLRAPGLMARLFSEEERGLPVASLAGRFAAKEALAKALNVSQTLHWVEAVIPSGGGARPDLLLRGKVRELAHDLGVRHVHLSISHEADFACATVILEGDPIEGLGR